MQVHTSQVVDGPLRVTRNDGFAAVAFGYGSASIHLHTPADCDALIAAAVEAKRLLDPPVITDSGRDCDQANPASGAHCHRSGDHGVHRDTDGEEWRTDLGGERADGLYPCCGHCVPACDGRQDGHQVACTTPGCVASATVVTS